MRRSRKQGIFIGGPEAKYLSLDRTSLEKIRDLLNEKQRGQDGQDEPTPIAQELIRLMKRLESYGGNLERMMDADPHFYKEVERACTVRWTPSKTGAYPELVPSPHLSSPAELPDYLTAKAA